MKGSGRSGLIRRPRLQQRQPRRPHPVKHSPTTHSRRPKPTHLRTAARDHRAAVSSTRVVPRQNRSDRLRLVYAISTGWVVLLPCRRIGEPGGVVMMVRVTPSPPARCKPRPGSQFRHPTRRLRAAWRSHSSITGSRAPGTAHGPQCHADNRLKTFVARVVYGAEPTEKPSRVLGRSIRRGAGDPLGP